MPGAVTTDRLVGTGNADAAELAKFSALAHRWWAPESEFKPLHDINPLRVGKAADLTAVRIGDVETLPMYDPVSHLVNAVSREHVSDVWIGGARLLESRQLQVVDSAALASRARAWQQRLA